MTRIERLQLALIGFSTDEVLTALIKDYELLIASKPVNNESFAVDMLKSLKNVHEKHFGPIS